MESTASRQFYESQGITFVEGDFKQQFKDAILAGKTHFDAVRQAAIKNTDGKDFVGVDAGGDTWLFAVSQKYINELTKMIGKECQTHALHNAFGFAP